ncbi:NTP transferase domain-containing protein [Pelagerythrobacter sp.]|uniref:nucleotidyltransferase family protein n=1 Tax=Pelagerythrobacter sp. TaxID=2800702 RepID=UPI0035AF0F84
MNALVLAGTRPGGDPFAWQAGVAHKALIELDGIPMLARVVAALRESGVTQVAVSCDEGPVAHLARELDCLVIPPAKGPSGSVAAAFEALGAPLLVTTADHALLRAEWVEELVRATPADSDVSLMLARRETIEAAVPGSQRTYLRFADGHWSGCNLFYLRTPAAARALALWQQVEADRKRPWRIVARLGPGMLLAYLAGRLTLAAGIGRLAGRIGLRATVVPASDGRAAVDVDKPSDLETVRELLRRERG